MMCQSGVHLKKVIEVTGYHRCSPCQGCQDMEKADINEAQGQPSDKALSLAMVVFGMRLIRRPGKGCRF